MPYDISPRPVIKNYFQKEIKNYFIMIFNTLKIFWIKEKSTRNASTRWFRVKFPNIFLFK